MSNATVTQRSKGKYCQCRHRDYKKVVFNPKYCKHFCKVCKGEMYFYDMTDIFDKLLKELEGDV